MGEPAGVGGELTLKAWRARTTDSPAFFVIDDPDRLTTLAHSLELDVPIRRVASADEATASFSDALPVLPIGATVSAEPGAPTAATASSVVASIDRAAAMALSGEAAAVVTNPIQKSALIDAGFAHPGHTEHLAALTAGAPAPYDGGPLMLLASPALKVAPLTIHCALRDAIDRLTTPRIVAAARTLAAGLSLDFGIEQP
ncbi:MAG: 4-hydroxythreonine-4-phosphate dehydrogenase PdxA, partial [Pseudomonadota bacterium]